MRNNKQIYIDFIVSELNKGNVQYKEVISLFLPKFACTRQTFDKYWKLANEAHREQRKTINIAKIKETIIQEKEAVKTALKSKLERLIILQNEIDNCISELSNGMTIQLANTGELIQRPLTIKEKTDLRNTMKNLQAEVSKIEGDYAVMKSENINHVSIDNFSLKDVISFDKTKQ